MKTRIFQFCIVLLFFLPSCLDYDMNTRVNRDGSLERTFRVAGDSAKVLGEKMINPVDSTWQTSFIRDTGKEDRWVLTAKRTFKNVEELNRYFYTEEDTAGHLNIRAELKKKFRWFYTYYEYRETYYSIHPFRRVPLTRYISPYETDLLFPGENEDVTYSSQEDRLIKYNKDEKKPVLSVQDSVKMKKLEQDLMLRLNRWEKNSVYEEFYYELQQAIEKGAIPTLDTSLLQPWKVKVWEKIEKTLTSGNSYNPFDGGDTNDDTTVYEFRDQAGAGFIRAVLNDFADVSGKPEFRDLFEKDSMAFASMRARIRNYAWPSDSYTNHLVLPGLIIHTNATINEANTVTWKVPSSVQFINYEMVAESRVVNSWSLYTLAALLLILLAGIIAGFLKKRK